MASQFFFTSSPIIFLLFSISSLFCICQAHYSPSGEKLLSTLYSLKNSNATQKGDIIDGLGWIKKHLADLGYIDHKSSTPTLYWKDDLFDDTLESAIKIFQKFYNLKITGILDQETLELLSRPRCGVPDFHSYANISSSVHNVTEMRSLYKIAPPSYRWPSNRTQFSLSYPKDFRKDGRIHIVRCIFKWKRAIRYRFRWEDDYAKADIKLSFQRGDHGDGNPFKGTGTYAHAFPPSYAFVGQVHFNGDVSWQTDTQQGKVDLESVILHELGHIFGLDHSPDPKAVMYAYLGEGERRRELTNDDIQGIRALGIQA